MGDDDVGVANRIKAIDGCRHLGTRIVQGRKERSEALHHAVTTGVRVENLHTLWKRTYAR